MESFFRYIAYVDYYKDGEKIRNVGFLQWKLHNNVHFLEVQVKDVDCFRGNYEIIEKNTQLKVGEILIDKGIGAFSRKFLSMEGTDEAYINVEEGRLHLHNVEGFFIRLNQNETLYVNVKLNQKKECNLKSEEKLAEEGDLDSERYVAREDKLKREKEGDLETERHVAREDKLKREREGDLETERHVAREDKLKREREGDLETERYVAREDKLKREREGDLETERYVAREDKSKKEKEGDLNLQKYLTEKKERYIEAASENILIEGITEKYEEKKYKSHTTCDHYGKNRAYADSVSKKTIEIIEPLHDDKWQQLCKEYPKVHPFPGKSTFLSIKPEDFIILQQEYQKLVHNSFLLHGFYNYGHMVLGKLVQEEEAPIYIGVPGVYYEREKQAARMFGFVGFESTKQPVQSGSYGYYMIEVKI